MLEHQLFLQKLPYVSNSQNLNPKTLTQAEEYLNLYRHNVPSGNYREFF